MIELAWPIVACLAIGAGVFLALRALPAKDFTRRMNSAEEGVRALWESHEKRRADVEALGERIALCAGEETTEMRLQEVHRQVADLRKRSEANELAKLGRVGR